MTIDTQAIVVGGGPVGLSASIMLSRLGIEHVVLERHAGTSIHPKAIGLNQRTNEVFRAIGVADRVIDAAAPPGRVGQTGWYTSFAGPTEWHGRRIALRDAWGGGGYAEEYSKASPAPYTMLPQIRLEPILREAAESYETADIRFGHEVVDLRQDDSTVTVMATTADGKQREFTAPYLLGADGGRFIADQLGVEMDGQRDILDMVSAHFSADLSEHVLDPGCLIHWLVNPDLGGSIGSGYLYHLGPWDADGRSKEWVFACGFGPDDPDRFDTDAMLERITKSLGLPELVVDLHSISHWYIQSVVARTFSVGRCHLIGDAAHRIPPWGALGLNTGIQDAYNLTWKIALAIREPDLATVVDTYEIERLPVAQAVAQTSLANFMNHGGIMDAALGLKPGMPPEEGWSALKALWADDADGEARRSAVEEAVRTLDLEFHAHGAENGFGYPHGALVSDPSVTTMPADTVVHRPETVSGRHLPHVWLHGPEGRCSTLDLIRPGRFLLIVSEVESAWAAALARSDHALAGRVDVIVIGPDGEYQPSDPDDAERLFNGPGQALLVRPDTMIGWRAEGSDSDISARLGTALSAVSA